MSWRVRLTLAAAAAAPSVVLRLADAHLQDLQAMLVFGGGVVAAAFLLAWAAEAAEVDIPGSMAIALLAVIAVLPEFAVDLYFAFTAGHRPSYAAYAAANMTGSNRLLIGCGWSVAALVFLAAAHSRGARPDGLKLASEHRIELGFLGLASLYAIVIPLTHSLAWYDAVVLIGLFAAYMWRVSQAGHEEPGLIGVAAVLAAQPARRRRPAVAGLFLFAAVAVLAAAQPFAEGLLGSGRRLGIDEFLLVQWLAPLASEAPELLVATMFAFRGKGEKAIGTLLAAEVSQWTLLVGAIPVAYAVGGGGGALHLDPRQHAEFILTSAQAVLGFAVLVNLRFHLWEALTMVGLFALQFALPSPSARDLLAIAYLTIAAAILARHRRELWPTFRTVLRPGAPVEGEIGEFSADRG